MTGKLIQATAALIAAVLRRKREEVEAIGSILIAGFLRGYSYKNLQWLCKQSALETGFWDNVGTSTDRNVWGMSCVNKRKNTQIGCRQINSNETSGVYSTIYSSVVDRFLWDAYWGLDDHKRDESYPEKVGAIYHTDPGYAYAVGATSDHSFRVVQVMWFALIPLEAYLIAGILKKFI